MTAAEVLQLLARGTEAPISTVLGLVLAPVIFGGALFGLICALIISALRWPVDAVLTRLHRVRVARGDDDNSL